ncbi:MAG: hypothetical protein M3421_07170 [Bacteroidota bacterium]|jgi:hypothetical protein|nr:hypothetical protein [Bacteroidota bacterium]
MKGKDVSKDQQSSLLSQEQEALLDLYINSLDNFMEAIRESEKLQVKIETLHLKRILTK